MSCFLEEDGGERVCVLTFKRTQLLYDIENYAYIEGSVLETESNHNRHMVQDVGQEGNVDRVTRVLDVTIAKCKEKLYPYTKHEVHKTVLKDKLHETPMFTIILRIRSETSQTTLNLLERLIHEYLVCTAVADWMSITNPEKEATWKEKAEDALSEMRVCLQARMGRVRRRQHPF